MTSRIVVMKNRSPQLVPTAFTADAPRTEFDEEVLAHLRAEAPVDCEYKLSERRVTGLKRRSMTVEDGGQRFKSWIRTVFMTSQPAILGHHAGETTSPVFSVRGVASFILSNLTPEILQRRKVATRRPGPTAWLDGLRGWAAFCVCLVHLAMYTHLNISTCYGQEIMPELYNTSPVVLPFIRLFFSGGHFAVMIFFTISGYVLTRRLISLIHQGRNTEFIESLNSAIFRRPARLVLPVVWSTFAFLLTWNLTGISTPWPPRQPTFLAELFSWCKDMMKFVFLFQDGTHFTYYNMHTWTIPVELRGSMLIFLWLFATHQCSVKARILLTLTMTLYHAILAPGAIYACFLAGMLTAELDLYYAEERPAENSLPWDFVIRELRNNPKACKVLVHVMLISSLYLGSEPSADGQKKEAVLGSCYGWQTLSWLIPKVYNEKPDIHRWFWLFWAAWMLLVSCKEIPWARNLFETPFSQYLGRHSYALYLIHGPMIGMFSERLFYLTGVKVAIDFKQYANFGHLQGKWHDASWWPLSGQGPLGLEPNYIFCVIISIPVFLYVAEIATRLLDVPSVKVAKWSWAKVKGMS